ncbi:sugar kinase [Jannaschia sp. EhC01]|nr:sugar kinase [Jannaschia sp. EhC01]
MSILDLVRRGGANTRLELERTCELGRAIVADRLATLAELGLVDETKSGTATGGRAPKIVRFRREAGCVLVASLDQNSLGIGLADLSGHLLTEHHEAFELSTDPVATVDRLVKLAEWVLSRNSEAGELWGIGLSVPGPVTTVASDLFQSVTPPFLPGWEDALLIETLVSKFGAPVWIRSSVETMTMGELSAGEGADVSSMLYIKVGKRIGAGLVIDRELFRGASGAAGLIGQLPVTESGQTGPLEVMAGADMIHREGHAAALDGRSSYLADIFARMNELTPYDVGQAAQSGDPVSMEILSRSGRHIGHAAAYLATILNPELIVIGGGMAITNDTLLAAVREVVYRESHPLVTRDLRIVQSQMGSSAGLVGAAMVVTEALFAQGLLRGWLMRATPRAHPDLHAAAEAADRRLSRLPEIAAPPALDLPRGPST